MMDLSRSFRRPRCCGVTSSGLYIGVFLSICSILTCNGMVAEQDAMEFDAMTRSMGYSYGSATQDDTLGYLGTDPSSLGSVGVPDTVYMESMEYPEEKTLTAKYVSSEGSEVKVQPVERRRIRGLKTLLLGVSLLLVCAAMSRSEQTQQPSKDKKRMKGRDREDPIPMREKAAVALFFIGLIRLVTSVFLKPRNLPASGKAAVADKSSLIGEIILSLLVLGFVFVPKFVFTMTVFGIGFVALLIGLPSLIIGGVFAIGMLWFGIAGLVLSSVGGLLFL